MRISSTLPVSLLSLSGHHPMFAKSVVSVRSLVLIVRRRVTTGLVSHLCPTRSRFSALRVSGAAQGRACGTGGEVRGVLPQPVHDHGRLMPSKLLRRCSAEPRAAATQLAAMGAEAGLEALRASVHALCSPSTDPETRRTAEAALIDGWRTQSRSWSLVSLIGQPGQPSDVAAFAASSFRQACVRDASLVAADTLPSVLTAASEALARGAGPLEGLICAGIAALAVRALSWPAASLLDDLFSLAQGDGTQVLTLGVLAALPAETSSKS